MARAAARSVDEKVLDWLLEGDQPSVRYLALTRLLGKPDDDPEVKLARGAIARCGWAADILGRQDSAGWWASGDSFYVPKYLSSNWMLLILADLGLSRDDPRIGKACQRWLREFAAADGGFNTRGAKAGHHCITGNMARALVQFGYVDHPRVRAAFEWLARTRARLGGWSCFGSGRNLDSWEGLSAFAVYPRSKWTLAMEEAVRSGAEFFLERELHEQGGEYAPWHRFHYPVHYYYDLLVGLEVLTALGYAHDPRLRFALDLLGKKRRRDGRWNLDAVHPDVEGGMAAWLEKHPKRRPTPFALEEVGQPSKMITLRAMQVLQRVRAPAAPAR